MLYASEIREGNVLEGNGFPWKISIIINNKRLQNKLSVDLKKKDNLCIQIRSRCNEWRHSARFSSEERNFQKTTDLLIKLLQDPKALNETSENAVTALEQLKIRNFEISVTDVKRVLTDEIGSCEDAAKTAISDHGEHVKENISETHRKILCELQTQLSGVHDVISAELLDTKIKTVFEIVECSRKQKASIEKTGSREQRKLQRTARQLKHPFEKEETSVTEERLNVVADALDDQFKDELREHLIELYQREHNYLPISPVIDRNKAPLLSFFVNPTMYYIDIERQPFRNEESTFTNLVNSYNDIFWKGDKKCRNIYLVSPAGSGKTCFSKHMTLTWCQAWTPDESKKECFDDKNVEFMKTFSFLFLISLRNCRLKECDVDDIIRSQLFGQLPVKFKEKGNIEKLFESEECLILIDGLDEWSHPPKKQKKCPDFLSTIPHRKLRLKSTVLTTTRRWKFHDVSDKDATIDQHIEIEGLDEQSSDSLIEKFVTHLNLRSGKPKNPKEFDRMLTGKGLQNFKKIPLILLQLLCLWYSDKDPGESKCQIFSNMIELLFTYASKRVNLKEKYKTICHKERKRSNRCLPRCFKDAFLCRKFRQLLFSLAKLSYETLFGENYDNSLVFDQRVVDIYLSANELALCKETGILLQSKEVGQLTTDDFNYSFVHKTFQELLAALYISTKSDLPTNMIPKMMKKITGLDGILRMEMFFVFLGGLSASVMTSLSREFIPLISKDEVAKRYRRNIGTIFIKDKKKMHDLSDLMIACVQEISSNEQDAIIYHEDIFVDADCSDSNFRLAMLKLIETNKKGMKSLYIHIHQTVPDEDVETVIKELKLDSVQSLVKLFLWGSIPPLHVQSLLKSSSATMKCLEMWNLKLTPEYLAAMVEMETSGLSLMSVSLAHKQIDELMMCLAKNRALKQLNLNKIICSNHGEKCQGYRLQLCNDARPQLILLDKVHVTDVSLNATCLETCIAELLPMHGALTSLLNCLSNAPVLKRFECDSPAGKSDMDVLTSFVPKCEHLHYFRLRNVNLSDRTLKLSNMKAALVRVHIWHASMTVSVFQGIVKDIESLEQSVIVILENISFPPSDQFENSSTSSTVQVEKDPAESVKEYIRTAKRFEVLYENCGKYPEFHFKTAPR